MRCWLSPAFGFPGNHLCSCFSGATWYLVIRDELWYFRHRWKYKANAGCLSMILMRLILNICKEKVHVEVKMYTLAASAVMQSSSVIVNLLHNEYKGHLVIFSASSIMSDNLHYQFKYLWCIALYFGYCTWILDQMPMLVRLISLNKNSPLLLHIPGNTDFTMISKHHWAALYKLVCSIYTSAVKTRCMMTVGYQTELHEEEFPSDKVYLFIIIKWGIKRCKK